jgi:hypothetical protein
MPRLSSVWRFLGFIFLGSYIAFNVLDLDGSELWHRPGPALVIETASAEPDRASWAGPVPASDRPHLPALDAHSRLRLYPADARFHPLRSDRLLPHRHVTCRGSGATTPPADPA